MDFVTLGLMAAMSGLAYLGAKRSENMAKAEQALIDPSRVKAATIAKDEKGEVQVKEDPGAKARAGVALAVQSGKAKPDELVGTKLADGSEVVSVKRDLWGNAQSVIKKPDGTLVVSVPVYTNGDVWYYEMPIVEGHVFRAPTEINGVKLPEIKPYISLSSFWSSLDKNELISKIGVGATTRLARAVQEYVAQWYDEHQEVSSAERSLSIAYSQIRQVSPEGTKEILPIALGVEIRRRLETAQNALASAQAWANHVGGDTAFNEQKAREMQEIANREMQKVAVLTEVLKSLGITDVSGIGYESAKDIMRQISSAYPEALQRKIQEFNQRIREINDEKVSAAKRASALTGMPGVTSAEILFQMILSRTGGNAAQFDQAIREVLDAMLSAHPSTPRSFINTIEEAAQYSEYASRALEKIKADPALRAKYEEYKKALERVRTEYEGRIGIPIELTTGAVLGKLSKAGLDKNTLEMLRRQFNLDSGDIKGILSYVRSRFAAVGQNFNALEPWERAVLALYESNMPPEIVREMLRGGTGAGTGIGASTGTGTGAGAGTGTSVGADAQIISDIDKWIRGKMSDEEILRGIDRWIKGEPGSSAGQGTPETGKYTQQSSCPHGYMCIEPWFRTPAYIPESPPSLVRYQPVANQPISDRQIISDIDRWVRGEMSDAEIARRIDSWVKGG